MKKPTQTELANAIAEHQPTKPMSIVRALMPQINASIDRGMSKKEIWEGLSTAGLNITYKNFLNCVTRIEARNLASAGKPPTTSTPQPPAPKETVLKSENERNGMSSLTVGIKELQTGAAMPDYAKILRKHTKDNKGKP